MKFNTLTSCCCIWIFLILFANQALSESVKKLTDDIVLPVAIKLLPAFFIPPPAGPIIAASLGIIQICSNLLEIKDTKKEEKKVDLISKLDLMEAQAAIINEVRTVDRHLIEESAKIIRELTLIIKTTGYAEKMRERLNALERTYIDMMKVIINPKENGIQKRQILKELLNYSSDYRYILRSFISEFIKPNDNEVTLLKPAKLFFEFVMEKENLLAETGDDCSFDSLHNKMFKSFLYILKVLTEAYSMVISAHVVTYQQELNKNTTSDPTEYADMASTLINDYKNDVKILIETTKKTLVNASQEIRNCGKFKMERGKTFERLSFIHILPKILHFEYIEPFVYKCKKREEFIRASEYEINGCRGYTDIIPFGSRLSIAVYLKKPYADNTPYSYIKVERPDNSDAMYGRNRYDYAVLYNFKNHEECFTTFCSAFKNKLYAISTQRVSAEPGNVITGVRFRVTNWVVYIDIQQGKFRDLLTVDPETVFWTETPETNQTEFLSSKLKKIELGDFVLKNNSILTSIQLQNIDGLIRLSVDGLTPPYMNNTDSMSYENGDLKINELELVHTDDPGRASANSTNFISKPPVANERYFVNFQTSSFEKDLGQSTIPLIEIREVVSDPPAPLNGLGIYHEAVNGYGGFIAFKLITPNLIDLLDSLNVI